MTKIKQLKPLDDRQKIKLSNGEEVAVDKWMTHTPIDDPEGRKFVLFRTETGSTAIAITSLTGTIAFDVPDDTFRRLFNLIHEADHLFGINTQQTFEKEGTKINYHFHEESTLKGASLSPDWLQTAGISVILKEVIKACQNALEDADVQLSDSTEPTSGEGDKLLLNPFNALLYYKGKLSDFDSVEAYFNSFGTDVADKLFAVAEAVECCVDGRVQDYFSAIGLHSADIKESEEFVDLPFYVQDFDAWTSDLLTRLIPTIELIRQRTENNG